MNLKAACRPSNKCFSRTHRWYRIWPTALLFGAIQARDVLGQNISTHERAPVIAEVSSDDQSQLLYTPTGQLPLNFPTKPAANDEPAGKDRVNVAGVLWPFGHGLSYTTFKYSELDIQPKKQSADGNISVSFKLTNSGSREGDEVPQLYIHQEVSSVTTWEKRLCGFDRVQLAPGETKVVTLTIAPENLAIWNLEMKRVIEPGNFKVMVGASSKDIRLNGEFEIAP